MWKKLRVIGIVVILVGAIPMMIGHQQRTRAKNSREAQADCERLSITFEEKHTCDKEAQNRIERLTVVDELLAWPTGIETLAIIATGFFVGWQALETRNSAEATVNSVGAMKRQADLMALQTSALRDSVEIAEKSLILQFRPKIVVRGGGVNTSMVANIGKEPTGTVSITLVNSGSSNAKIYGSEIETKVIENPINAIFKNSSSLNADSFELSPGENRTFLVPFGGSVNDSIREADLRHAGTIRGGTTKLVYLVGVIWYVDELGIKRSTGLFRRYDAGVNRFVAMDDPDYEYTD